jgi:hypothetical protein
MEEKLARENTRDYEERMKEFIILMICNKD